MAKASKRPKRGPKAPSRRLSGMNEFIYQEIKKKSATDPLWTAKKNMSAKQRRIIKELSRRQNTYTGFRSMSSNLSKKYTGQISPRGITTFGGGSKYPIPGNVDYTVKEAGQRGLIKRTGVEAVSKTPAPEQQKLKIKVKKDPLQGLKPGAHSPIKIKNIKLSPAAKKALLKGAKLATKGATRVIPGVGTAMLVHDAYKVTKWAMDQPKSNKKRKNIYGTDISKSGYTY
tara:strand:+ start:1024 stop:1710 length:687 start_codon:yes stop_codon:yes gene_type:complete